MRPETRNPTLGRAGSRKIIQISRSDASEHKPALIDIQAAHLSRRYCLPLTIAAVVASLAFPSQGGRT
jgi:hypothetical protein